MILREDLLGEKRFCPELRFVEEQKSLYFFGWIGFFAGDNCGDLKNFSPGVFSSSEMPTQPQLK